MKLMMKLGAVSSLSSTKSSIILTCLTLYKFLQSFLCENFFNWWSNKTLNNISERCSKTILCKRFSRCLPEQKYNHWFEENLLLVCGWKMTAWIWFIHTTLEDDKKLKDWIYCNNVKYCKIWNSILYVSGTFSQACGR